MDDPLTISILEDDIEIRNQSIRISQLKYLESNPRVHSAIRKKMAKLPEDPDELQQLIHKQLEDEPSVRNLIPKIRKHGGLQEPIFVRFDTMEVIEGNSRLRAYHYLYNTSKGDKSKWGSIPCVVVTSLTKKQQNAYLNQIHVEGKTPWLTFEKANHAYNMVKIEGCSEDEAAQILSVTAAEVRKRVKTIQLMTANKDTALTHFSYYDVLVRNRVISEELRVNKKLESTLLKHIKEQSIDSDGKSQFKAMELRDKLPSVISKKRTLNKFADGKLTLEEAYDRAKLSGVQQTVNDALGKIDNVKRKDIDSLDVNQLNAVLMSARKLEKKVSRLVSMIKSAKSK